MSGSRPQRAEHEEGLAQEERFCRLLHRGRAALQPGDLLAPGIVPASVYHLPGQPAGEYQYGRWSNPTWTALEEALSELEDADTAIFPSGVAAISALFFTQLQAGDRILLPADGYYGTRALAEKYLLPRGLRVEARACRDYDAAQLEDMRLVWIESPSNPTLDVCDIAAVAERAHAAGALVVVDNTTPTPLGQRPFELGADAVVMSDTKCIGGHSDVVFGHVASRSEPLMTQVREWRRMAGAIPGPFEAWLVHRGLETLEVRYDRMCASAALIAERLAGHERISAIRYPGLTGDPAYAVASRQMSRPGFLIGVTLEDAAVAEQFIAGCKYVRATTSFGGVHSSAERRARWGDPVAAGFVRLSIGCEPVEVLWKDLAAALAAL